MIKVPKSSLLLVVGALFSGLIAAWLANSYISSRVRAAEANLTRAYTPMKVVVPTTDLPRGTILSSRNLAIREIPKTFVSRDAIPPGQFQQVSGRRVLQDIRQGDQLQRWHVSQAQASQFAALIPEGQRAVTLPVDRLSSVSGLLAPGDTVDILVTVSSGEQPRIFPLMLGVPIIATGMNVGDGQAEGETRYNTITIPASPEDASRLLLAQQVANITVVLRSAVADAGEYDHQQTITRDELLGISARDAPPPPKANVEIIVGGR